MPNEIRVSRFSCFRITFEDWVMQVCWLEVRLLTDKLLFFLNFRLFVLVLDSSLAAMQRYSLRYVI